MVDRIALARRLASYRATLSDRLASFDWFGRHVTRVFSLSTANRFIAPTFNFPEIGEENSTNYSSLLSAFPNENLFVVGESGTGKSTAIWRIIEVCLTDDHSLPILLPPARYQLESLTAAIMLALNVDDLQLSHLLHEKQFVILIDRFNETQDDQDSAIIGITSAVAALCDNAQLVVASRRAPSIATLSYSHSFKLVRLMPLAPEQIVGLLQSLFRSQDLIKSFISEVDGSLRELCKNPLLLQMLASIYSRDGRLPSIRSEVYEQFLNTFVHADHPHDHAIPAHVLENALRTLALHLPRNSETHPMFRVEQAIERSFHAARGNLPSIRYDDFRAHVLRAPVLIYDAAEATIRFIHSSVQEFFAACAIVDRMADNAETIQAVAQHVAKSNADDLAIFLAGLVDDATELVLCFVRTKRLRTAGRIIASSRSVSSAAVEEFTVRSLDAFKFLDDGIQGEDIVSYDLLRGLQIIRPFWRLLPRRLQEDCQFFTDKYSYSLRKPDGVASSFADADQMIASLRADHENPLRIEYLWTIAQKTGTSTGLSLMRETVESTAPDERDAAIYALGEHGSDTDVTLLLRQVAATGPSEVIVASCNALIRLSDRNQLTAASRDRIRTHLAQHLRDRSALSREAAAWTLFRIFGSDVAAIISDEICNENPPHVTGMIVFVIGELAYEQALPRLIALGKVTKSAHVREDLASALLILYRTAVPSSFADEIEELISTFCEDEDGAVRMQCARGLASLSHPQPRFAKLIEKMSRDPKPYVAYLIPDGIRTPEWEGNDESYASLRSLHTLVLTEISILRELVALHELGRISLQEYLAAAGSPKGKLMGAIATLRDTATRHPELSPLTSAISLASSGRLHDVLLELKQSARRGEESTAIKEDAIVELVAEAVALMDRARQQ
jgi:HEAT repeat protein